MADDFFTDGVDLIERYTCYFDQYDGIKSRRLKSFIDLRMALESLLKSAHALHGDQGRNRKVVIREVESFRHDILSLANAVRPYIPGELRSELWPFAERMKELPVGLRYALDGYDFIYAREELYYQTIGNDHWMDSFHKAICNLKDEIDKELSKHSGVVSLSDIPIEKILNPGFNKYSKKK